MQGNSASRQSTVPSLPLAFEHAGSHGRPKGPRDHDEPFFVSRDCQMSAVRFDRFLEEIGDWARLSPEINVVHVVMASRGVVVA